MVALETGRKSRCRTCDMPIIYHRSLQSKVQGERPIQDVWVHHQTGDRFCAREWQKATRRDGTEYYRDEWGRKRAVPNDLCVETVDSGSYYGNHHCYRRITNTEFMMCGIHAKTPLRQREENQQREAAAERHSMLKEAIQHQVDALAEHGLTATIHTVRDHGRTSNRYDDIIRLTGRVVVDPQDLLDMLSDDVEEF